MQIPSFLQAYQGTNSSSQSAAQNRPAFDLNALPAREVTQTYKQSDSGKSSDNKSNNKQPSAQLALPSAPPAFASRGQLLNIVV